MQIAIIILFILSTLNLIVLLVISNLQDALCDLVTSHTNIIKTIVDNLPKKTEEAEEE